jgi:putative inorganic carbon (HCO3(-)) transporter
MTFPLTLLFIFLVFWRPQEWLLPWMYGWPVLDVITYGALISLMLESGQKTVPMPKTPAIMLAVGLWFASVMSHVAHTNFQGMIDTIPETFKPCFFLLLLVVVTNSIQRLRGVMFVLLLGAVLMAIHSVMQERTGAGFAGLRPLRYYYVFKERWVQQSLFFGIFGDPNDLGQFLATCMPLAFALPKKLNFMALALMGAVVWLLTEGMLATESRGTLIGVVASVACLVFLFLPVKWLPYVGTLMLIAGLVACAFGGGDLLDQSARDRVVFWGNANRYFKTHFLLGGGYGLFGEISGTNRAAHNAFVLCYTELGLFGYWFWFNMLLLGIVGCWRTRVAFRKPKTPAQAYLKRVSGLAIASIVGFSASAYFLSRAYVFPLFFLFALLASIPLIAMRYLPEGHPPLINFRKDVLFTGTLASLFSVAYIYVTILLLNRVWGG